MRLFCNVAQYRVSFRHGRGKHHVDGGAYAHHVEKDLRADEAIRFCADDVMLAVELYLCAERAHALQMLVDGARTDHAAARQGKLHLMKAPKQRAKQIIGSAHAADRFAQRFGVGERTRVDAHAIPVRIIDGNAQLLQDFLEALDVLNMRQILQYAGFARENCGRYDGDRGVFRAADGHGSFEPVTAFDLVPFP